nr:MAG: hypothetical protein [Bacteriophage sp.]UVY06051.1 MAG: hypothetical protein [Bacteriophage sp.]UVY07898.1 MAG: hypothetical protein [Bacteriophage sp.]UVY38393.1 MAG: hypothetical protein [Bacteriophage sp.]UWG91133.1 MAG: hypothetical protein [Bacteriophage sp.]
MYFYFGKNTGSYFDTLKVTIEIFVWRQKGYVFFEVRSLFYAPFLLEKR